MLNYEFMNDAGILMLHPDEPLSEKDFITLTIQVDSYLLGHGKLHGILIHAKKFPGWKNFSALLAHLKFLKNHLKKVEKVAVVADGVIADILPGIAGHFVHAEVRHFDFSRENEALAWLKPAGMVQQEAEQA
jgi:hypothetical protein